MKMGAARSRYANRVDVSVLVAIPPERRDWNFQTVACAAGGVPEDPLTITLTLLQGRGEICFVSLLAAPPTPLVINPSTSNASAFYFRGRLVPVTSKAPLFPTSHSP